MADTANPERVEPSPSALGSVVEADGFRVESMSLGNSDEGLKATMREFLESEQASTPAATAQPTAEPTAADAAAKPAADEPKPNKAERRLDAIQQRIAEATKRKHEAESAVADAERRLRDIEARLTPADPAAAAAAAPATPATPTPTPAAADPKPRWTGEKGYEAQGKTYAEFEDDLEAWDARAEQRRISEIQKTTETLTEAQKTEREKAEQVDRDRYFDQRHRQRLESLRAEPEIAAALASQEFQEMPATPFMTTLVKLHDQGAEVMKHFALNPAEGYEFSNLELSREMKEAFRDSENPVGLISALVNNPEEAARIATLSGTRAHKALWALEQPTTVAKAAPTSPAPRQLATPLPGKVQASRSVATARPITELTTDDFDEFLAREAAGAA